MIYTNLTRKAIMVAYKAHEGQMDRAGLPYILHPIHVAEQMKDEDTCVVALLHDVIEDTDITLEDLRVYGFTEAQIEGVRIMTHEEGVEYFDYIRTVKTNPLALAVKLEDLKHNSDETRIIDMTDKDIKRLEKYKKALKILTDQEEAGDE
ncbi:MAG: GTP pyrophosphokinase [Eubacterium sp.]|nr:GTP pyrophosphokinase [Eubacterium sp.]